MTRSLTSFVGLELWTSRRVQVIDGPGESTFVYISTLDQFFQEETLTEYEILEKSKMSIDP